MWWKVLLSIFGLFVVIILFGMYQGSKPENAGKFEARQAIELCWKEQERKSLTPEEQRVIASACESMEANFRNRYRVNP